VRKATGREKAETLRIAVRLAYFRIRKRDTGKDYYVMVQRGFPGLAIEVGETRQEVQRKPLKVALKLKTFRQWARSVGRLARGPRAAASAEIL